METLKYKISLDNFISRKNNNWGVNEAKSFSINIFISSNSDDMGVGTDTSFIPKNNSIPNYTILIDKLSELGLSFNFMNGGIFQPNNGDERTRSPLNSATYYYIQGGNVSGLTEDRLDTVKSYDINNEYIEGLDIESEVYTNFQGNTISGGTRVTSNNNLRPIKYTEFGDVNDLNIGNINHSSGIFLITNLAIDRNVVINNNFTTIPRTEFYFNSEGFNETNVILSATTKEEYLFGISQEPLVQSDVFIDRGVTAVNQSLLQLSEITNMLELENYGNGYYNIIK